MIKPVTIIAEAGVNHNGDASLARKLIDAAAQCGADAVKFQTFIPERVASDQAPKAPYQERTTGASESQLEMLRGLCLDRNVWPELIAHCENRNIEFMSTPFDPESAALLNELGMKRFKIGSGELTNTPFLKDVAGFGKPMILSTGMADLGEVADAVAAVQERGCSDLTLLHCVSNYPADPADANLHAMATMADAFGVPVGWSDHMEDIAIALAAAALGAAAIEKHFTLDRTMAGPDHAASLEPDRLAVLVKSIREIEKSLGNGDKKPAASEIENRNIVRRSLVAATDIRAGEKITAAMLDARRPAGGLPPSAANALIGLTATRDIKAGTAISRDMAE